MVCRRNVVVHKVAGHRIKGFIWKIQLSRIASAKRHIVNAFKARVVLTNLAAVGIVFAPKVHAHHSCLGILFRAGDGQCAAATADIQAAAALRQLHAGTDASQNTPRPSRCCRKTRGSEPSPRSSAPSSKALPRQRAASARVFSAPAPRQRPPCRDRCPPRPADTASPAASFFNLFPVSSSTSKIIQILQPELPCPQCSTPTAQRQDSNRR